MRVLVPTSRTLFKANLSIWDVGWALTSPFLALYLRDADIVFRAEWGVVGPYWITTAGFSLIGFLVFRIQDEIAQYFSVHEMLDIAKAIAFAEVASCIVLFLLTRLDGIPRSTPVIHGLLLAIGLIATRAFLSILYGKERAEQDHSNGPRIILIGANRLSAVFIRLLNAHTPDQRRVIAVLDERRAMTGLSVSRVRILGTPQHLEAIIDEFVFHGIHTEQVIIAGEADFLSHETMREVQRVCDDRQLRLAFLPQMIDASVPKPAVTFGPETELQSYTLTLPSFYRLKRWVDICGSLALIVLLLPLLVAVALLVLLDLGVPILFWQQRLGRGGCPFHIYKFRTLRPPFDPHGNPIPENSRLSAIGRLLRVTRIDELPQLLNVLKGDMSLIGPRPLLPEDQPSNTAVRLLVRPGITGWAQVHGGKLVSPDEKAKLDEWYIRNASVWLDLWIVIMTLRVLLKSPESAAEALADVEQVQSKSVAISSAARKSSL